MTTAGYLVLSGLVALCFVEVGGGVLLYRRRSQLRRSGTSTLVATWTLSLLLVAFLATATTLFFLLSLASTFPRGGF